MKLVVIESPFAGNIALNINYARACIKDCLNRGEAPIASHLLYTQDGILDDSIPNERLLGIKAGYAWYKVADSIIFYMDNGLSVGMETALRGLKSRNYTNIKFRKLSKNNEWIRYYDSSDPRLKQTKKRLEQRCIHYKTNKMPWEKGTVTIYVNDHQSEKNERFLKHLNFVKVEGVYV